jgi:hypothetical protein
MRRSLVKSLKRGVRGPTWRPTDSEKALAYCLQAIEETERKIRLMKSHAKKIEENINRTEWDIQNGQPRQHSTNAYMIPLSSDDFNTGETDNSHTKNLSPRNTLSQTFLLTYLSPQEQKRQSSSPWSPPTYTQRSNGTCTETRAGATTTQLYADLRNPTLKQQNAQAGGQQIERDTRRR